MLEKSFLIVLMFCSTAAFALPDRVVIIRHGDKDAENDSNHNLDSRGFERSLKLAGVLSEKFPQISGIFAPDPVPPKGKNIRSLQTITPYAVKTGINIDTSFRVGDEKTLCKKILGDPLYRGKTLLVVWEHNNIRDIMSQLGVADPGKWKGNDFDTIVILTFRNGRVSVDYDREGIR